tara:strand:+ start:12732 stop:13313 length:582 start_codon:yes stop_codon:yes gene_type:complete
MSKNYFEHLNTISEYSKVIVTGPHGAGNKITAYIIESDYENLEHQRWEEDVHSIDTFKEKLNSSDNYVSFCPSCSGLLHEAIEELQDVLVIFMYKDINEIKNYRVRNNITQSIDEYELPVYEDYLLGEGSHLGLSLEDGLEEVTYALWEQHQEKLIPNSLNIEHSSLSSHWKWVPKKSRTNFEEWQTEIGEKP